MITLCVASESRFARLDVGQTGFDATMLRKTIMRSFDESNWKWFFTASIAVESQGVETFVQIVLNL